MTSHPTGTATIILEDGNRVTVKGTHLDVNDGVLLVTGDASEVAVFASGEWSYAHITQDEAD